MIEISHIDQSFRTGFWLRRTQVLHDVTFQVPRRSVFGFLGANGAGKTTLIHLIAGLRRPTAGIVRVDGHEATRREARAKLGYLPERPYFHEHLTGEGVLRYFGALSGMLRTEIDRRVPEVLAAVGISHARKLELKRYSKGMLQRLGIAQALIHNPEFLLLDEPMSGLDPLGRKEMRELILGLAAEGRTIFFSSHVIPDVEAICDQVALIQKGRLVGSGPISRFLSGPEGAAQEFEIAFSGITLDQCSDIPELASLKPMPEGVRGFIRGEESIQRAIEALFRKKASILWLNPVRPGLESFFDTSSPGQPPLGSASP